MKFYQVKVSPLSKNDKDNKMRYTIIKDIGKLKNIIQSDMQVSGHTIRLNKSS